MKIKQTNSNPTREKIINKSLQILTASVGVSTLNIKLFTIEHMLRETEKVYDEVLRTNNLKFADVKNS